MPRPQRGSGRKGKKGSSTAEGDAGAKAAPETKSGNGKRSVGGCTARRKATTGGARGQGRSRPSGTNELGAEFRASELEGELDQLPGGAN